MSIDLSETLRLHSLCLQDDPAGVRANLRGADLRGAVLRDANLCGAVLRGAVLCDANLLGAVLRGADLRGASLRGAVLRGAVLRDANLLGADLRGAVLRGADLRGAVLRDANLCGAVLRGADLRGVSLCGAKGLPITEDAPARLQAVAAAVLAKPEALQMNSWHSDCGTAHCLAGTAIHQAGALGAVLEQLHGPALAGLLLLGSEAARHFYDDNEAALDWLRSISTTTPNGDD